MTKTNQDQPTPSIEAEREAGFAGAHGSADAPDFISELRNLINKHSMENASNTPDFSLAQYLTHCLRAWNQATQQRETWYGRDARPTSPPNGESSNPARTEKDWPVPEDTQTPAGPPSCAPTNGSEDLAYIIAAEIMHGHNRNHFPLRNHRIQFMAGTYPDAEIAQGGYGEAGLAACILDCLRRHLPNDGTERQTPRKTNE